MTAQTMVTLSNGLTLQLPVLLLLWDLEARGVTVTMDGTNIAVGPAECLTDLDREEIRRWRYALETVVAYANKETVQ